VVLRIEDIDSPRVKPWAIEQAITDLAWLGLDWDEGPDVGGAHGPYLQTERAALDNAAYDVALARLIDLGMAYPCTCSRKDVESSASAPHESADTWLDGPIYSGHCSRWRASDPLPEPDAYCWRFRSPDRVIEIEDRVCGPVSINPGRQLGDFPLTRKNGQAAYQLAVVVDDAAMGITEVVRGDDLLPSVFRQVPIIEALGYEVPQYIHVPLVVGGDGRRLAKRHGDTRLSQYRDAGVSAERIVGWAAHSIGLVESDEEIAAAELLATFDWDRVRRGPTAVTSDLFS
jgi:glutamyl-tRNA synthetase